MRALLLIVTLAVGACAAPGGGIRGDQRSIQAPRLSVQDDSFRPYILFEYAFQDEDSRGAVIYSLIATVDRKTKAKGFYLDWSEVYIDRDWRFYSGAGTSNAEQLPFSQLDRKVASCRAGSCVYSEAYRIRLSEAQFRRGETTGLAVKVFSGRAPDRLTIISPHVFQEVAAKMMGR